MDPTFEDEVPQIAEQIVQEEQAAPVMQVVYHVFRTHKPAPPPTINPTWIFARESPPLSRPYWDGSNNTRNMFNAMAINIPKYVAPVFK
jgi:hypothetical protein